MQNVRSLRQWFKNHIADNGRAYTLDKNQAKIVLDSHKHTLVTARAGSGKTRTIVAKAAYLLAHEKIPPDQIIIFSFNRKARAEVNERLHQITYDGQPVLAKEKSLATTFHAFAYQILGGKNALSDKLTSEATQEKILNDICLSRELTVKADELKQFITRAEQQFFTNYDDLATKINRLPDGDTKTKLQTFDLIFKEYRQKMQSLDLTNFNQIMADAAVKIENGTANIQRFKHIFVDEYQDFSKLFLTLIKALLKNSPDAKFLAVGDDWQSINRFAGSNVDYFLKFENYFTEDNAKLFIPTNYRSGRRIVQNANFFMGKALSDYNGCKSGNKQKAKIYYKNIDFGTTRKDPCVPLLIENYLKTTLQIIRKNPNKTIKILSRNNDLRIPNWSLEQYVNLVIAQCSSQGIMSAEKLEELITYSTIHRSKGLEADIVILLEIDENKFPAPDKTHGLYKIFGDDEKTLFQDEARLFYVALTRPKEKLYILSKTTKINKQNKKYNFFHYLNEEYLEELE